MSNELPLEDEIYQTLDVIRGMRQEVKRFKARLNRSQLALERQLKSGKITKIDYGLQLAVLQEMDERTHSQLKRLQHYRSLVLYGLQILGE